MKEGKVILSFFLPAHQQAAGAIDPRVSAFHHPAMRSVARDTTFFLLLLAATVNMRQIVAGLDLLAGWCSIITCIQAQVLWLLFTRLWTANDDAIESSTQQFHIVAVGSINDDGQGNTRSIR